MKNLCLALSILVVGAISFTSCLKKDFDSPPDMSGYDPQLTVNAKLSDLKTMALTTTTPKQITGDSIVYGIVTADDRSGNFYKEIVIQDSTSGIVVLIDANSLYNDYPVGRKVYVKLKNLYVGTYKGVPQIGFSVDATGSMNGIPASVMTQYVVEATYPNTVTPEEVTMADLNNNPNYYLNRLVKIDSVEFTTADAGQPYAQPSAVATGTGRYIENCSGDQLEVYSSGYANFQPYMTPAGKGTITGIYSVYGNSAQFLIRDTTDVNMTGTRCDGTVINPTGDVVTIDSVRNIYNLNGPTKLGSMSISGIVIGTNDSGNLSKGNIILQNGNRGIAVFYGTTTTINYHIGDSLVIDVTGDSVTSYKGSLEIKYGSASKTQVVSSGNTVTPVTLTIGQINSQYFTDELEYTLVQVQNVSVNGSTYSGNRTLTDGTGSLSLYTGATATFASQPVPSGTFTITGFLSTYNNAPEMQLRAPSIDVQP